MRWWRFAVLAVTSACYQPEVESCVYTCAAGANPCPQGLHCLGTMCVHEGDTCGTTDPGFYDVHWDNASGVAPLVDALKCERRPILDPSRTYLVVARPTTTVTGGNDCINTAALELYRWNDGNPTKIAGPASVEASSPIVVGTFIGDGSPAGLPGDHRLFVYRADTGGGTILLKRAELGADLQTLYGTPSVFGTFAPNSEVTFDASLTHIVYSSNGDLYEGTGTVGGTFTGTKISGLSSDVDLELSPTMTPDGRVLVFVKTTGGASTQTDLYVARRREIADPWSTPEPLPNGPLKINTPASFEYDPYITSDGDLLFTSTRTGDGTRRRIYLARHL